MNENAVKQAITEYYTKVRDARGYPELGNTPPLDYMVPRARVFQIAMYATSCCFFGDGGFKDTRLALCAYSKSGISTFRGIIDNYFIQHLQSLRDSEEEFISILEQCKPAYETERGIFTRAFPFADFGRFLIPNLRKIPHAVHSA